MDNELLGRINELKRERNAIILAHNYQLGEIQDIADLVGDSLELSRSASRSDADVVVFCGVYFMAETASILCPDKVVLFPNLDAGCPLADMITAESLREEKEKHPDRTVVCYVNSPAEVKAESDICCTSANAIKVVESIPEGREIIFVPDYNLGHYVATRTGRKLKLWPGYCPSHIRIKAEDILREKEVHRGARVMVHPECVGEVIALADEVLSTSGMLQYALASDEREIIVGTEIGIIYRLRKENPKKMFIPASEQAICPTMKLITLEDVLWALEDMAPEVRVSEEVRIRARASVDRMLEIV